MGYLFVCNLTSLKCTTSQSRLLIGRSLKKSFQLFFPANFQVTRRYLYYFC